MSQTGALDALGNPVIDLPLDIGDGPFMMAPPDPGAPRALQASVEEQFRRTEPFQDNWLTNNQVLGPSSQISLGRFHVSDSIRPGEFRRVHQTYTHRPSPDLDASGTFEIWFTGAGEAIVRQGANATVSASGALGNAMLALDDGALIPHPTMYAASTTFKIRLRMPGYEPVAGVTVAPEPGNVDARTSYGRRLLGANKITEFSFGNSSRERKVIDIPYPVGRSIPVIFDIVNLYPAHICIVDFFVDVMINRTSQNQR